jgi:hypothetical protein
MRIKEKRVIVAFHTTHEAMAFEEFCLAGGVPGRLIPLPGEIAAGCGLAYSSPPENLELIKACLDEAGIIPQHLVILQI